MKVYLNTSKSSQNNNNIKKIPKMSSTTNGSSGKNGTSSRKRERDDLVPGMCCYSRNVFSSIVFVPVFERERERESTLDVESAY